MDATEQRIEWFTCPVCDGDEGYAVYDGHSDDWIDCDCCEGAGGFADITPAQRDRIVRDAF